MTEKEKPSHRSKERPIGEVITSTRHMGEYIGVRARLLDNGVRVGRQIVSDKDPEMVHALIRKDIKMHENTGTEFLYFFYKPFKPGEDREGWLINGQRGNE